MVNLSTYTFTLLTKHRKTHTFLLTFWCYNQATNLHKSQFLTYTFMFPFPIIHLNIFLSLCNKPNKSFVNPSSYQIKPTPFTFFPSSGHFFHLHPHHSVFCAAIEWNNELGVREWVRYVLVGKGEEVALFD